MVPWILCCAAAVIAVWLGLKLIFLYKDLGEISRQFHDRLREDTNNVIYVPGNDRHLKHFAGQMNSELHILYDMRRRYQNGDRELKEAVTNISHDLRTPLTAIYGYLELLEAELNRAKDSICDDHLEENVFQTFCSADCELRKCVVQKASCMEQITHYTAQIRNRADAMRELTEELFRYSMIVAGQGKGENQGNQDVVILNRILADSLLSYYDIFRRNQIEPEIRIPEEKVVRCLDAGALKRVFGNILDNAVKYSRPAHNTVCGFSGAELTGKAASNMMVVELSADGTITFCNPAEHLDKVSVERLFDRFYTVETGRNSTGLGLSIAKLLTERMGGSIMASYTDGMLKIVVKL